MSFVDLLRTKLRNCFLQGFVFAAIPRTFIDAITYLAPPFTAVLVCAVRQLRGDQLPVPKVSILY